MVQLYILKTVLFDSGQFFYDLNIKATSNTK